MERVIAFILSYGGMATVGLLCAAGCAVALAVHEKLDWPVLFPIWSLSLLPLYLGAKLFGVLSLMTYRLSLGAAVSLMKASVSMETRRFILSPRWMFRSSQTGPMPCVG